MSFEKINFALDHLDKLKFDGQDEARITKLFQDSTEDRIESNKNKEPIESNRQIPSLQEIDPNRIESIGAKKKDFIDSIMEKLQDKPDSRAFYEWLVERLPEPTITRLVALTCEAAWVNNKGAYFNRLAKNELQK